jgi:uncharacterized protein
MSPEIERRVSQLACKIRSATGSGRAVGGYTAVFNSRSELLGDFYEIVSPRFFAKGLGDNFPGVVARWNHRDELLLGTIPGVFRAKSSRTDAPYLGSV